MLNIVFLQFNSPGFIKCLYLFHISKIMSSFKILKLKFYWILFQKSAMQPCNCPHFYVQNQLFYPSMLVHEFPRKQKGLSVEISDRDRLPEKKHCLP